MKPVRVLHLTPPGFGGIDAYIFSHYRHMDQSRFRFEFLTQNTGLEKAEPYRSLSYKVWPLPVTAAQDRDGFIKNIRHVFQNQYDALHLHTSYWTGFLLEELAKEAGIPKVIVHAHSTGVDEEDEEKQAMLVKRHEEIKRVFSPDLATDYWACSRKAAGWLFGGQISRERIRIMKNAIEAERFRFDPLKREKVRRELGIDSRALVLGTAGRLSYQKNHSFLIDMFAEFHRSHQNSRLIILGDGERRESLTEQVRKNGLNGAVLFLGWRQDVENYLTAMDCFLLPSEFEGFGIVVIEAVASGLPCVVSEHVPEEVEISSKVCRIPLEIPGWLRALEEAAEGSGERLSGVELAKAAGYDVRQQAKVLEALYEA
ncbi:MAG: glycosyltransferase [Dysosmobacter sp.]|nr:glycosyltransferase [Dysosmobacter sp.]